MFLFFFSLFIVCLSFVRGLDVVSFLIAWLVGCIIGFIVYKLHFYMIVFVHINSSIYTLSNIVCCSKCGEIYRWIAWNNRGKYSTVWRCCTRVEHGPTACDAPIIQESDLQAAVVQAINLTLGNRENMMMVTL